MNNLQVPADFDWRLHDALTAISPANSDQFHAAVTMYRFLTYGGIGRPCDPKVPKAYGDTVGFLQACTAEARNGRINGLLFAALIATANPQPPAPRTGRGVTRKGAVPSQTKKPVASKRGGAGGRFRK